MSAKSKQQRKFMGMVHALQEKEITPGSVSPAIRQAAKTMTKKQSHDFAATPEKGLPTRVRKSGGLHKLRTKKVW